MDSLAFSFRHNEREEELGDRMTKRSQKEKPLHPCFNICQLQRHDKEMKNVWRSVRSSTCGTGSSVKRALLTWGSSVIAFACLVDEQVWLPVGLVFPGLAWFPSLMLSNG